MYRVLNLTLNTEVMRGTLRECRDCVRWYNGQWSLKIEKV